MVNVASVGRFSWPLLLVAVPVWQVLPVWARGLFFIALLAIIAIIVLYVYAISRILSRKNFIVLSIGLMFLIVAIVIGVYTVEVSFQERVDFEDFVHAAGLVPERHHTVTEDGFILSLHRVLPHFNETSRVEFPRLPILMQHGLMEDSAIWLMFGNTSLAYALSTQGFDVWLGNSRATLGSLHHEKYDRNDKKYWDWSFHEMAKYDVVANIEYILAQTGAKQLVYVGQSQGCGQMLAALSLRPELEEKVKSLILLAPGAFVRKPAHPFLNFVFEYVAVGTFGEMEFIPYFQEFRNALPRDLLGYFGYQVMHWMGFLTQPLDLDLRPIYYIQTPSGSTSIKNLNHWTQLSRSGEFVQFDYGVEKNKKVYQSEVPPAYPVEKIQTPISLYLADQDNVILFNRSQERIPHQKLTIGKGYSHCDFVWSSEAPTKTYPKVVQDIKDSCANQPWK